MRHPVAWSKFKAACESKRDGDEHRGTDRPVHREGTARRPPPNTDPLAGGILDSLAIEFLIGWLEEEFEISFSYRDVVAENFASIGTLSALVDSKRPGSPGRSTEA